MRIGVVTDSSCDLPAGALLRYGVAAVPLKIHLGSELYRDWRDIDPATLYRLTETEALTPQVEAPDVEDFLPVYRRFLRSFDAVVSIHLAGGLSATVEHARGAVASLGAEERITVLDSGSASVGLAEMVLAAAAEAQYAERLDQVLWAAEQLRDDACVLFAAGRSAPLGSWNGHPGRRLVATLLRHRPLLTASGGGLVATGSARPQQVPELMLRRLAEHFGSRPLKLTLGYAGYQRSDIEQFKRMLERSPLVITRGRVQLIGPALGTLLGPGTTAICAYPDLSASLIL